MSAIEVCQEFGKSQWRNKPEAYLQAKAEANKRIASGQIQSSDCVQIAEMAIRQKNEARAAMNSAMDRLNDLSTRCDGLDYSNNCSKKDY